MTIQPPAGFEPIAEPELEDFPRTWRWDNDGDTLQGDYQGTREINTKYGPQQVHRIVTDKEPVEVFGSAVLNRKIQGAEVGQEVWIKYLGKQEGSGGNKFSAFEVFVKPAAAA